MEEKSRTKTQNDSIHLYFEHVAQELNDSGNDMRKMLKETIDIPWTKETVKDYLWRTIQKAMLQKDSTTGLTRAEVSKVYDVLNRHLSEKTGVHVPFPSNFQEWADKQ
jgi:hypothetical protein